MSIKGILHNFLIWRIKHITTYQFLLILSGLTGILAGLAAVSLKEVTHDIQIFLLKNTSRDFIKVFYPAFGIMVTVILSRYFWKERLGHGVTSVLFGISQKSSLLERDKIYNRWILSAITVGFGGSVGLEAPIVLIGAAIGSNLGQLMHMNYRQRTILIGCGAAGAIAGIFNSPITGVIFASEVILAGVSFSSFVPLLIAAVTGSIISISLLGDDILFSIKSTDPFLAEDSLYYVLLGAVCGVVSVYFTRTMYYVEAKIKEVKNYILRAIIGGTILGIIIFVFPQIYGEGYETITLLLKGDLDEVMSVTLFSELDYKLPFLMLFLFFIILIKPVATALTIGSGGSGGIFAPSLFLGGVTGFLFAVSVNLVIGEQVISLSNFTLVGMSGIMSGVLRAPLTAIFLIAELTGGYTLFVPLMIVSTIAFTTSSYFEKYSLYTKKLIERGQYVPFDKDRQLLNSIQMRTLIETDLHTVRPDQSLEDLVTVVKKSKRNIYPVVNDAGELEGVVTLDDIRNEMFDTELQKSTTVSGYMHKAPANVSLKDTMRQVMNKFERTGAWNLPVIDDNKYVGFLSKSRIFSAYRSKLRHDNRLA